MSTLQHRAYLDAGTGLVEGTVDRLDGVALAGPSALPGWTRAHVVAHLARNADGLVNLLTWAATGVEHPMYASLEQRAADIEASAGQAPDALRADLHAADGRLAEAIDGLPAERWDALVRHARGHEIPVSAVPWMRVCELWIHAVDLDAGVEFADWPAGLAGAVLDDTVPEFAQRDGVPGVLLSATDSDGSWRLGTGENPPTVAGAQADLLAYLLGRPVRGPLSGDPPELPPWK